ILSPNLTWEAKAGVIRQRAFAVTAQPFGPADMGINLFDITKFPGISFGTVDNNLNRSLTLGSTSNFAKTGMFQNRLDLSSSLNWVVGRHTVSFGVEWDRTQLNIINQNNEVASIGFTNFSQFLIGNVNPSSSTLYNGASNRYYRANTVGAYAQDNYKIGRDMTLNLGVRYDFEGPLAEKYGKLVNFDTDKYEYDAVTDTITNSGLVLAKNSPYATPGTSTSTLANRHWGFGPRIGVAWGPEFAKKLTIRSGFGLYFDRGELFTYF